MNYPVIFKILGIILGSLQLSFVACWGISVWYSEYLEQRQVFDSWIICIVVVFTLMTVLLYLGRKSNDRLMRKESLCIIGLGWLLASAIGAIPYYLTIPNCSPADALFEASSGLTTTGATVFDDIETLPRSLIFWRCMSQWIGGLGVVVFFVAILSFLGAGAKILFSNESSSQSTEIDSSRIQHGVRHIVILYLFLSVISALMLRSCGMNWFDAVCHMFAALSTGGFSTYNDSVEHFNSPVIEYALCLIMFLGATSFILALRLLGGDLKALKDNDEFIAYVGFLFIFSIAITVSLTERIDFVTVSTAFRQSLFQVISIMTSTGFSSVDFDKWPPVSHTMLILAMTIGGCAGSTAGGLKVIRVTLVAKLSLLRIEKAYRTLVIRPIRVNRRYLSASDQDNVLYYVVLVGVVCFLGLFLVTSMEPLTSFQGVTSTIFATFFNVGPGFAEVGPTKNYGFMHESTKYFLAILMIMGRLELYAILALFCPSLWKRFS